MLVPCEVQFCPYCNSRTTEIQFNFDAKLITCINKQCSFPFQEENFNDYIIIMPDQVVMKKPPKKLVYQPNRPPLYITPSRMASIRMDLPDMTIPKTFHPTRKLPPLPFFSTIPTKPSPSLSDDLVEAMCHQLWDGTAAFSALPANPNNSSSSPRSHT